MSTIHQTFIIKTVLFLLGFGILITIPSCGRDADIPGCINPTATNFNVSANLDDGSCISPIDQFIGTYTGALDCAGRITPIVNNMNQEFVISQLLSSDSEVELQLINSALWQTKSQWKARLFRIETIFSKRTNGVLNYPGKIIKAYPLKSNINTES